MTAFYLGVFGLWAIALFLFFQVAGPILVGVDL